MAEDNTDKNKEKAEIKDILAGMQAVLRSNQPKYKTKFNSEKESEGGYYTRKEALNLQPLIDQMIEDKEDRELRFEDYKEWSPNTMWCKLNQALKFIVDYLDTPDKKYRAFRDSVKISRESGGILIKFVFDPQYTNRSWILHKVQKNVEDYKTQVYKYMETSKEGDPPLDLTDLSLSEEEVESMKVLLGESPIFLAYVSPNRIKIVHSKIE